MTTIAEFAVEHHAQPYEVAAFFDLGNVADDTELDSADEPWMREAWMCAQLDTQND